MKKKYFWESRIVELGGTDHRKTRQYYDIDGKELPGARGYKYYGAAKDLPGVRELFQNKDREAEAKAQQKKRSRGDITRHITPDYYGYRDDDDGVLEAKEAAQEAKLVEQQVTAWHEKTKRLALEVRRSGGVYGSAELALMESSASGAAEEVIGQVVAAAAAASATSTTASTNTNDPASMITNTSSIEEQIIASKKAKLLSHFL
jgi:pre-mRNA-splicing factor ISY1